MKYHFLVTAESSCDLSDADIESVRKTIADAVSNACSVRLVSNSEAMHMCGFNRRPTMTSLPKDACPEPERAYVAAYTEVGTSSYPAFVSINREKDGFYSIAVRTRGHDGNQMATIDKMSRNAIRALAWDILEGDDALFRDELKKLAQKGV